MLFYRCLALGLLVLISACGGSGSGNSSGSNNEPVMTEPLGEVLNGKLASSVSGLNYSTRTLSGITDAEGGFTYRAGEIVTFSFGKHKMGETLGKPEVTLYDIAGVPPITHFHEDLYDLFDNTGYRAVVNMAVFLHTFDYDNNPDNGIDIRPEVVELFAQKQVNFRKQNDGRVIDFAVMRVQQLFADSMVTNALVEANRSIFPHSRPLKMAKYAMADLHATLGLASPPRLMAMQSSSPEINQEYSYEYDARGNLTHYAYSSVNLSRDNVHSYQISREWDAAGYETLEVDTSYNRVAEQEFDEHGRIIYRSQDEFTYTYDWDNGVFDTTRTRSGKVVWTRSCRSNREGNQLIYRCEEIDQFTAVTVYLTDLTYTTFDQFGNKILVEFDKNNDGIIDQTYRYEYDDQGNITYYEEKDGIDIESRILLQYDDRSNLVSYVIYSYGDVYSVDYEYDEFNNKVATYVGDLSRHSIYHYENNRLIREEFFENNALVKLRQYDYDANGNRLSMQEDSNIDGIFELVTSYQYDDNNNRIRTYVARNGEFRHEILRTFSHEASWFNVFHHAR